MQDATKGFILQGKTYLHLCFFISLDPLTVVGCRLLWSRVRAVDYGIQSSNVQDSCDVEFPSGKVGAIIFQRWNVIETFEAAGTEVAEVEGEVGGKGVLTGSDIGNQTVADKFG